MLAEYPTRNCLNTSKKKIENRMSPLLPLGSLIPRRPDPTRTSGLKLTLDVDYNGRDESEATMLI